MNRVVQKTIFGGASLFLLAAFAGCAVAMPPAQRISREDIRYAIEHGSAIVEAEVGAGKPHAVGTRSEGYGYPLRVLGVLRPATANISQSFTYDYSKTPRLSAGRYVIILQPGPYYRAERLSSGSARLSELRLWTQHP
jgi:hypothetical protein